MGVRVFLDLWCIPFPSIEKKRESKRKKKERRKGEERQTTEWKGMHICMPSRSQTAACADNSTRFVPSFLNRQHWDSTRKVKTDFSPAFPSSSPCQWRRDEFLVHFYRPAFFHPAPASQVFAFPIYCFKFQPHSCIVFPPSLSSNAHLRPLSSSKSTWSFATDFRSLNPNEGFRFLY